MVLIASSSVFPYGMMGRSVDGEKIERREVVADVLVFRFCSYSGVASRHACLTHNARVDVLVGSLKARLHQPVAALSATTCHIPPAACFVFSKPAPCADMVCRVSSCLVSPVNGALLQLQVTVHY